MLQETTSTLTTLATKILKFISKYRYPIGGVVVIFVLSATINHISVLSEPEMNQELYNQGLSELEKVTFNEEAIDRIDALDKRTVNVTENIDSNRNNPF